METQSEPWPAPRPRSFDELCGNLLPKPERGLYFSLCGLRDVICAAALRPQETAVADAKLAWWGEELTRLTEGTPRHPVTSTIAGYDARALPTFTSLREFLTLAESLRRRERVADISELRLFCFRRDALPLALYSAARRGIAEDSRETLWLRSKHVGIALGMSRVIRRSNDQPELLPHLDNNGSGDSNAASPQRCKYVAEAGLHELQLAKECVTSLPLIDMLAGLTRQRLSVQSKNPRRDSGQLRRAYTVWRSFRRAPNRL